MKVAFYAIAAVCVTAPSIVTAADLLESHPSFPSSTPFIDELPEPGWDGPYAGLFFGFGWANGTFNDCGCASLNGRRVGTFIGYNWAASAGFVVGAEGEINYDWNRKSISGSHVGNGFSGSARLRLGEEVGDFLPYIAAGWTVANAYVKDPDDDELTNGWTAGAGVDWAATETTFMRLEYRYNSYSPVNLAGVEVEIDQDVINIGIAHKF